MATYPWRSTSVLAVQGTSGWFYLFYISSSRESFESFESRPLSLNDSKGPLVVTTTARIENRGVLSETVEPDIATTLLIDPNRGQVTRSQLPVLSSSHEDTKFTTNLVKH